MRKLLFFRRRPPEPIVYSLPHGIRVYAVGDVHGRLDCLNRVEERIAQHAAEQGASGSRVIFIGDYVDRGPDSRGVIEKLAAGRFAGLPAQYLLGNHEDAMLHFLADPGSGSDWLAFGGNTTLASYGVRIAAEPRRRELESAARDLSERLPPHHLAFLQGLDLTIRLGGYLFVHAGVRPGVDLARQRRADLLTIREPFLTSRVRHPWRVVHGHTVVAKPELLPSRIGIDTGAYATGKLSCIAIAGVEAVEL